jgi:hypothetical protein
MKPPGAGAVSAPATNPRQEGHAAFLALLADMSPQQRVHAARSGAFDRSQRALWASTYPDDVPLVNGELEWIALGLADLD